MNFFCKIFGLLKSYAVSFFGTIFAVRSRWYLLFFIVLYIVAYYFKLDFISLNNIKINHISLYLIINMIFIVIFFIGLIAPYVVKLLKSISPPLLFFYFYKSKQIIYTLIQAINRFFSDKKLQYSLFQTNTSLKQSSLKWLGQHPEILGLTSLITGFYSVYLGQISQNKEEENKALRLQLDEAEKKIAELEKKNETLTISNSNMNISLSYRTAMAKENITLLKTKMYELERIKSQESDLNWELLQYENTTNLTIQILKRKKFIAEQQEKLKLQKETIVSELKLKVERMEDENKAAAAKFLVKSPFELDKLTEKFQQFGDMQKLAICLIIGNVIILNNLISIIFIFFGDFLIKKFKLVEKFPSLSKIIHLRLKFQRYYLITNITMIFLVILIELVFSGAILSLIF